VSTQDNDFDELWCVLVTAIWKLLVLLFEKI
jgi:hypothetical protein